VTWKIVRVEYPSPWPSAPVQVRVLQWWDLADFAGFFHFRLWLFTSRYAALDFGALAI